MEGILPPSTHPKWAWQPRTMYCLAEIDSGGYIYALTGSDGERRDMVHRESVFPLFREQALYERLDWAKEDLPNESARKCPTLILQVEEGEGAKQVWCYANQEDTIRTRLKVWSGCYGRWPVRILNEVEEGNEVGAPIPAL